MKLPLIERLLKKSHLTSENIPDKNKYQNRFFIKNFYPSKRTSLLINNNNKEEQLSNNLRFKLELKNTLRRVTSISYLNLKNNKTIKKRIKITNNINNDILNLNSDNNILFNDYSDYNKTRTLINSKSSFISIRKNKEKNKEINKEKNEEKEKDKLIIINNELKNKLNRSDVIKSKKIHEYNIKFNNLFWRNISWNNNILKNIFKKNLNNKRGKKEEIKNIDCKNMKQSFDKEKEKKNSFVFKSYNENGSSYFNSEINNFYNNCKYKNNKLKLSLMKERNINKSQRIYMSIFNENIYNNFCALNMNQKNENQKIYNLSSRKNIK